MEVTCWHCHAVFDPLVTGKRCPHCGHHPEAWLSKLRFAAVDFIGPAALIILVIANFREDPVFSALFVIGAAAWAIFIMYEDFTDWVPASEVPLSKPPMPDSWKQFQGTSSSGTGYLATSSARPRASGLTWAERLLILILVSALIAYGALHWKQIASFRLANIPISYAAIFVGLIAYVVRRVGFEREVLRDGLLAAGALTGWYDKSGYTRWGYQTCVRIRYCFWTESGQKFEGSGTLTSGLSVDHLTINQEPLKVFYLPQNPSKNIALCCTTGRPADRSEPAFS